MWNFCVVMDKCEYKAIVPSPEEVLAHEGPEKVSWKPLLRQLLLSSAVWSSYFQLGLCMGAPTVYIPQLRREANSTTAVSDDMVSWLSAGYYYSGIPWCILLPVTAHFIGRKLTFAAICVTTQAGFVLYYCSTTVIEVLISEVLQGPLIAAQFTVLDLILTECTSPKYRGVLLTIKIANFFWGIWISNAIGTFFHWKNVGIVGIVCSIYNIATIFACPESPYWLASKGRVAHCRAAHRWLEGAGEDAERELQSLIDSQQTSNQNVTVDKSWSSVCVLTLKDISSKGFYLPISHSLLLILLYYFSGKIVLSVYAIDIIKKMTSSESAAYAGMLILDGITVFSMYVGAALSRYLARRTLLFAAQFVGTAFLFIISLHLYLINLSIVLEHSYVSIVLLIAFSIAISCGPIVLVTSICIEILPLVRRDLAALVMALSCNVITATILKLAPFVFATLKLHGAFLLLGCCSLVCGLIMFKYLPETKDKTLSEIQNYYEGGLVSPNVRIKLRPVTDIIN